MDRLAAGFLTLAALWAPTSLAYAIEAPTVLVQVRVDGAIPIERRRTLIEDTNEALRKLLGPATKLRPSASGAERLVAFGTPLLGEAQRRALYGRLNQAWGDRIEITERPSVPITSQWPLNPGRAVDSEVRERVLAPFATAPDWDGYRQKLSDVPEVPVRVQRLARRGRVSVEQIQDRYWSQRRIYDALTDIRRERQARGLSADMDVRVLTAQVWQESRGDVQARGPWTRYGYARGIAQFIRETGRAYGLKTLADFHDPLKSLRAMYQYMEEKLQRYGGRMALVLASYNPGPSVAPLERGMIPRVRQTMHYVRTILTDVNHRLLPNEAQFEFARYMPAPATQRWLTRAHYHRGRRRYSRYRVANGLLLDDGASAA